MRYSRSFRRHHRERLIAKRYRHAMQATDPSPEHEAWARWNAVRRVDSACTCSGPCCGSARRFYGNGKDGKTLQELRLEEALKTTSDF